MLDINKPVQTRDGRKARIICKDRIETPYSIVTLVKVGDKEDVYSHNHLGKYAHAIIDESEDDLINVPEKHVMYVVKYKDNNGDTFFELRRSPARKPNDVYDVHFVACIKAELIEGQFDE